MKGGVGIDCVLVADQKEEAGARKAKEQVTGSWKGGLGWEGPTEEGDGGEEGEARRTSPTCDSVFGKARAWPAYHWGRERMGDGGAVSGSSSGSSLLPGKGLKGRESLEHNRQQWRNQRHCQQEQTE